MKNYFKSKDISMKEFFVEQGMEDKENLIMSQRNFASGMKIIAGNFYLTIIAEPKTKKSPKIEEQIRNLMMYKLREERKG